MSNSEQHQEFNIYLETVCHGRDIRVVLKNSPRSRNFYVRIIDEKSVLLTKPTRSPKSEAVEFLKKNADWIFAHLQKAEPRVSLKKYLENNPRIFIDGVEWKLWVQPSKSGNFFVEDEHTKEIIFACENFEDGLEEVFIKFATPKLANLIGQIAKENEIGYGRITLRDQSSRWASRSQSGTMSMNWRIMLLPADLQKYVVCHELAHAKFMDHSVSFWIYLNRICPDAKRLDKRLSKVGAQIFKIAR